MVVLYSVVGITSFDRYGATRCRNRYWRVCFRFPTPEGEVSRQWEGLLVCRFLARYWEHNMERSIRSILVLLVYMIDGCPLHAAGGYADRAEFWIVSKFWIIDLEVFG